MENLVIEPHPRIAPPVFGFDPAPRVNQRMGKNNPRKEGELTGRICKDNPSNRDIEKAVNTNVDSQPRILLGLMIGYPIRLEWKITNKVGGEQPE